jgi:hypothetical protein
MTDALRFEGLRLSTIRSTYWSLSLGLLLCDLVALGLGLVTESSRVMESVPTLVISGPPGSAR